MLQMIRKTAPSNVWSLFGAYGTVASREWTKSPQIVKLDDSPVRPNLIKRAKHYRVGEDKWQPIHSPAAPAQVAPARGTGAVL